MSQDDLVSNYTVSIQYDQRLYKQDIAGSVAHARMLGRQGIIGDSDAQAITVSYTHLTLPTILLV